jgi:DNA-directed RNA polymerase specialized sigma24 family protein
MKSTNRYGGIDPYVISQVRFHARRLIRHPAITAVEVEDLEQELMLHYLRRRSAFDSTRASWTTFIDRVLTRKCASLVDCACRQKRGANVTVESLDQLLSEDPNADDSSDEDVASVEGASDLEVDFDRALDNLSTELFLFLIDLLGENLSEVARRQGIHRSTVYTRIDHLRQVLEPLKDYLH